jgi:hypothetical protein
MKILKLWLNVFSWMVGIAVLVLALGVPLMDWYFHYALRHSHSGYVMALWMTIPFVLFVPTMVAILAWTDH